MAKGLPFGIFETKEGKLVFPKDTPKEIRQKARAARKDGTAEFRKEPLTPGFTPEEIPLGIYVDNKQKRVVFPPNTPDIIQKWAKGEYGVTGDKYFPDSPNLEVSQNEKTPVDDRSQPAPREPLAKDFAKDTVGPLPNAGRPANVAPATTPYQGQRLTEPPAQKEIRRRAGSDINGKPITTIETTLTGRYPQAAEILRTNPEQRRLYDETRIDKKGNLVFADGLDVRLKEYAQAALERGKTLPYNVFPRVGDTWQDYSDRNQKLLNTEIDAQGKLIFPTGTSEAEKDAAKNLNISYTQKTGIPFFKKEGQTWEQYDAEHSGAYEGGSWWMGPLGQLLPKDIRTSIDKAIGSTVSEAGDKLLGTPATQGEDIQLLTPEQRELQNLAIAQAKAQLPQVGSTPKLPGAPTLKAPSSLPDLSFNYPGYNELKTPQGFTQLPSLLQPQTGYGPIEERARRQFFERTIPTLAQRFSNLGGIRSGGYQAALGRAGSDLESQLAAQRSAYEERNRQQTFSEQSSQNQQELEIQRLQNALTQSQNAQQLQRDELRNALQQSGNAQQLAAQAQGAEQGLKFGQLQQQLYSTQVPNQVEAERQGAQGTLSLLQAGLQPRTEPVVQPATPGILQTMGSEFARRAPEMAYRYTTGQGLTI